MDVTTQKPRPSWLRSHWKLFVAGWVGLCLFGGAVAFVLMNNSDAKTVDRSR
jgi:hypothetical protein